MLLRRLLLLPGAILMPSPLGDGTLTPEVRRELDRLERDPFGELARGLEARVVANRVVMGPPASLEYAADQFAQGNWAPDPAPSAVPSLVRPAPRRSVDPVELRPEVPEQAPRPGQGQLTHPRDMRLHRLMQRAARDRARRLREHRAVIADTAHRMRQLNQRWASNLERAQSIQEDQVDAFIAAQLRGQALQEAAEARHLYERAERDLQRAEREYRQTLKELERRQEAVPRPEPRREGGAAPKERAEPRSRPDLNYEVLRLDMVHGFPEATVQRFPSREWTGGPARKRQKDRKTNAELYNRGMRLISRTYGTADEGLDLLTALADNVHYADGPLEGSAFVRRYEWHSPAGGFRPSTSAPQFYGGMLRGIADGTLDVDVLGFVGDYIQLQMEDWMIGRLGRAARVVSQQTGRPVGISAGPAL